MPGKIWPACDTPTQRLSKPRTNTSSSNLLNHQSQPSSPLTPSEPSLPSEKTAVKASQKGERRSRRQSRTKIRDYLHGQSSEEEDDQKPKGNKRGIRERLSRSSSSLYHLTSGKLSTTQLSNHSSRELDEESSERTRREITQKALTDSVAARNHVPEPVDEDKHPDAMKSPIRRRSLYTPGLATRSPDDLLRKPPQHGKQSEQSGGHRHRTEVPSSSPLDDLAALAVSRNAALIKSNAGRSTPTHFEQLGGLGLGTLRITNDTTPRPRSSSHVRPPASSSASHEDAEYFTASEGNSDDSSVLIMADKTTARTPKPQWRSDSRTPKPQRRSDSPLKYDGEWGTVRSQRLPLVSPDISPIGQGGCTSTGVETQTESYFPHSTPVLQSPDRASVFARDYMSQLPSSPYKSAPPAAHTLQDTADTKWKESRALNPASTRTPSQGKATEILETQLPRESLWQSFLNNEAEARHADSTTREDAYRILNGEVAPRDLSQTPSSQCVNFPPGDRGSHRRYDSLSTTASNTLSRSQGSSGSERVIKQVPATKLLPLNFVDSGYTSRDDIPKALRGELRDDDGPDHDDRWSKHQPSISDLQEKPLVPLRGTEACANPSADCCTGDPVRSALEVVPRPQTTITTCSYSLPFSQSQPMVPTLNAFPAHSNSQAVVPHSDSFFHDSTSDSKQSASDRQFQPPVEIFPQKARKLQKSRRISKPSPVDMTATQEISNMTDLDIPIIPPALASKHAERFREFPTLDHTYTGPDVDNQGGSRSSSNEIISVPIRFPSPAGSIEARSNAIINPDISWPTKASRRKSKELKAEQAASAKKVDRRMSQGEARAVIANFGTVADSLGNNPYDIAKPRDSLKPNSMTSSDASRCHPHQISTNMPRAKSMIGMDDAAAAEASRFRSDRGGQDAVRPRLQGRVSFPNGNGRGNRPQSMFAGEAPSERLVDGPQPHRGSENRGHQLPGNLQPRNAPGDVPPVPHLPSADETKYLEAVARRDFQLEVPVVQTAKSSNRPAKLVRPKSMYDSPPVPVTRAPTQMPSKHPLKEAGAKSGQSTRPRSLTNEFFRSDRPVVRHPEHNAIVIPQRSSSALINRSQNPCDTAQMPDSPRGDLANTGSTSRAQTDAPKHQESTLFHDAVNRLKKQRPTSAIPDMWKSDSLKGRAKENSVTNCINDDSSGGIAQPHEKTEDSEGNDAPQQKQTAPQPGTWEAFTEGYAKRQRLLGDTQPSNGKRTDSQLSRPVAAPSLHDALSAHGRKNPRAIEVSPMVSIAETPQDITLSPVSPLSTMHADTPISPAGQKAYYSLAPSPKATRSSPKNTNGTSTPAAQSLHSPAPTVVDGMPVGDLDVVNYRLDDNARHEGSSNKEENRWYRKPNGSPPKTPKKKTSLNSPSVVTISPTICNPTAAIADSYSSHAEAAPAPPPFSVPRKRLSGLSYFLPTPSARSLKPVRPVSGTPSATDTPPREDSASTSDSSQYNTPPPPPPPTSQPPTPSRTSPLPPPQQHSDGSPTKQSARSSTTRLPTSSAHPSTAKLPTSSAHPSTTKLPTSSARSSTTKLPTSSAHPSTTKLPTSSSRHSLPAPASASLPPVQGPIYPPSRFENLSGRYQGGLEYGYEPGVGIGGSAGTRVPKNGATRKSVDVGKMYGIDLSDVPIFVKHGPQKA
ncbi:MAG: hypothetical protein Q9195_005981 [Heterodermia aff. obscurata]